MALKAHREAHVSFKGLRRGGIAPHEEETQCQVCGEYFDTGNAKPYDGPAPRKYRKQYDAEMAARAARSATATEPGDERLVKLERLASLHAPGALTDGEYASMKAEIIAAPPST